jgi:hypothetical protein
MSSTSMVQRRVPRGASLRLDPGQLDEPRHPIPLSRVGLEEFQHRRVVTASSPGEGVNDRRSQVEVPDRDRVRVAV